ncbi:hypothetical protein FIV42_24605 [Persicimonas caeni]|uniref:Transporter n=1 Tax=Persicimonas caeni TaxID=2292766 RepID=A0A4Y6PZP9_PERCE|nr:hypothetical protein [Persicimonas caeni]QDG53808.1 hypothetical protein FIV42_24605 [Persicimonas caeni]QED35029.1 hypothetical protein FRD00_24600 [Persicimonas caeni]
MRHALTHPCVKLALTVVVAALLAAPSSAIAGPWVKEPGSSYVKLAGGLFSSDKAFDRQGNLVDPEYAYSHQAVSAYAEVGVFPSVALQFSVPFLSSTNELNERTRYKRWGAGDLDIGLQIGLMNEGCAASITPGARIPLYEGTVGADATASTIGSGTTGVERYTPALGDGSVDLAATAAFGCSLYPVPAWVTAQAGPRIRLNGFGDGVDYAVDGGIFVWPERLALTARVGGVQRFSDGNERPTKSYLTVGAGALLNVWNGFALEGNASYIPTGAFVARGWSASVGLSFTGEVFSNPYD